MALPGQVIRLVAYFDKPGEYVWHCHILSHEDHDFEEEVLAKLTGVNTATLEDSTFVVV